MKSKLVLLTQKQKRRLKRERSCIQLDSVVSERLLTVMEVIQYKTRYESLNVRL